MHPSDVPDIRARELLTVMALAEYGSFVAAAAYLKTSQPALTRTIKRVERVLGVTLFARNTRRVEITAAGREFVAVAERMLNELHLTVRNLSEVTNEQRGRITLTTYSAFAVNPLPRAGSPVSRDAAAHRGPDSRGPAVGDRRGRPQRRRRLRHRLRQRAARSARSHGPQEGTALRPDSVLSPAGDQEAPEVRLAELKDEPLVSAPNDTYLRRLVDAAAMSAGFTPALQRDGRPAAEHPASRVRRRWHRHPSVRLHSRDSVGRGMPLGAARRAVALGDGGTDLVAQPLHDARRRRHGRAHPGADGDEGGKT